MYKEKHESQSFNNLYIDPIDNYFECIALCDMSDGSCISQCIEILKHHET